jgi:SAM-dependent methyltransferase
VDNETTFTYWGMKLEYCRDAYNNSGLNERAVEVPIAKWFVADRPGEGLEVGNVLSHYGVVGHLVLDRYEPGMVLQKDVFDHHVPADWIVCVSTLEHVRWDEPEMGRHPDGSIRALEHLLGLLRPGGRMLVTVPFGWNPFFDSAILDNRLPAAPARECTFVRTANPAEWTQEYGAVHRRYAGTSIWADAVWVAEFETS